MSTNITVAMLRKMVAMMKENEIPPLTVKTRKEAREFTANDPVGHDWRVGDKYYIADLIAQQVPLGREFSEILHKNLWDLYEGGTSDVE